LSLLCGAEKRADPDIKRMLAAHYATRTDSENARSRRELSNYIRRKFVSPISAFLREGCRIKGKHAFFFTDRFSAGQAETARLARKRFAYAPGLMLS
jgi:hypothetical protein